MTQPRGYFVWHELLTPNKESATAFYPRVVSWKTQAWDKEPNYTLWTSSRGPLGGLGTLSSGSAESASDTPTGWLPFIGVADAPKTVAHAKSLGARVLTDVSRTPAGGEWAVIADPQGAVFAVYASAGDEGTGAGEEAPAGEFSWHELATTNYKDALKFYSALFGWTLAQVHDMGEMGDYALFGLGGRQIGGMFNNPPRDGQSHPPSWRSYVRVDDVDAAVDAATSAGGTVMAGPMDVPGGSRIAMMLDPDGIGFALHQLPKTPAIRKRARPARKPAAPAQTAAARKAPAARAPAKRAAAKKATTRNASAGKGAGKTSRKRVAAKKSPAKRRPAAKSKAAKRAVTKRAAKATAARGSKAGKTRKIVRRARAVRSTRGKSGAKASSRGRRSRR